MDFTQSIGIAVAGMNAQSARLKVVAENLANADSTAPTPGGEPYRRKVVTVKDTLDKTLGVSTVKVGSIKTNPGPFGRRYEPGHPAADADGYVLTPNVNPLIELTDMRDAQRSYEANLNVIDAVKSMLSRTIDLLRS
jgi:flagellar basal-body rod protein FlgC